MAGASRFAAFVIALVVGCGCGGHPPGTSTALPHLLPGEPPVRMWPATQPDPIEDVETMVKLADQMCDCAAQADRACAHHVVNDLRLWIDDVHRLGNGEMTEEQSRRANTAADRITECGDEVLGSASWCDGT